MSTTTHSSPFSTDHRLWLTRSFWAALASLAVAACCLLASVVFTAAAMPTAGEAGTPGTFGNSTAPAVEGSAAGQLGHVAIVAAWCCAASWSYRAAEMLRPHQPNIRPSWHAAAWLVPGVNVVAVPYFLWQLIRAGKISVPAWTPIVWSALVFVVPGVCATIAGLEASAHADSWDQGRNAVAPHVVESVYQWMLVFHSAGMFAALVSAGFLYFMHTALKSVKHNEPAAPAEVDVAEYFDG